MEAIFYLTVMMALNKSMPSMDYYLAYRDRARDICIASGDIRFVSHVFYLYPRENPYGNFVGLEELNTFFHDNVFFMFSGGVEKNVTVGYEPFRVEDGSLVLARYTVREHVGYMNIYISDEDEACRMVEYVHDLLLFDDLYHNIISEIEQEAGRRDRVDLYRETVVVGCPVESIARAAVSEQGVNPGGIPLDDCRKKHRLVVTR